MAPALTIAPCRAMTCTATARLSPTTTPIGTKARALATTVLKMQPRATTGVATTTPLLTATEPRTKARLMKEKSNTPTGATTNGRGSPFRRNQKSEIQKSEIRNLKSEI